MDNYASVLYDKELQSNLQKKIDGDNKIFVDTSSMYFGSNNAFSNYKEYSSKCRLISAIVYTKKLIMMMKWQMKC